MGREIVSAEREVVSNGTPDGYLERLVKYIPGEIIATYVALQGITGSALNDRQSTLETYLWVFFSVLIVLTPIYLWRVSGVTKRAQLALSTLAFGVWVFGIGGPFSYVSWYEPFQGGVLIILVTLVIPLIDPKA